MAPWKIPTEKQEDKENLQNILFILVSNLRKVALMLIPFFPLKMHELLQRIDVPYDQSLSLYENMDIDPIHFYVAEKGSPLYMRIATNK